MSGSAIPEKSWIHEVRARKVSPPEGVRLTRTEAILFNMVLTYQDIKAIEIGLLEGDIQQEVQRLDGLFGELKSTWFPNE